MLKKILKIITILISLTALAGLLFVLYTVTKTPTINANLLQTHSGTKITDKNGDVIWQNSSTIIYPIDNLKQVQV